MFIFFTENVQSPIGFKDGDPVLTNYYLLHTKYTNISDEGLDVRSVFFDISKAFDKVWHDDIIFKLK